MEEMQFSAIVLLTLLLLKLLLLPHKVTLNTVVDRSRWLMIIGITLLDLQFLLQYTLGLRAMGVTQAVLLNLLLFIPCSWIISLAIIYLQRQGELKGGDRLVGGVTWALAILLLGIAAAIDGQPLLSDSPKLHYAEITVSFLYLAMQGHYSWRLLTNLKAMQLDLQNYYDHDMDHILLWMKYSTIILGFLAVMVPMLIFIQSQVLAIFTIFFFISIFYLVDTFCNYMLSSAPKKMAKAEIMERLPSTSEQEHATTVPEASSSGSAEAKTLNDRERRVPALRPHHACRLREDWHSAISALWLAEAARPHLRHLDNGTAHRRGQAHHQGATTVDQRGHLSVLRFQRPQLFPEKVQGEYGYDPCRIR